MRAASLVARRTLVSSRGVRAAPPRQLAPWRCLTQTTAPGAHASAGHERAARYDRCGSHCYELLLKWLVFYAHLRSRVSRRKFAAVTGEG